VSYLGRSFIIILLLTGRLWTLGVLIADLERTRSGRRFQNELEPMRVAPGLATLATKLNARAEQVMTLRSIGFT
jgi:hypothetical protein